MKTLFSAALILLTLAACNRDRVESPEGATNDTVLTNSGVTDTASTNTETGALTDTAATAPVPTTTVAPNTTSVPPVDSAPAPAEQIAAGRDTYNTKCAGCHGADGKKLAGPVTLASAQTQAKPDADLVRMIRDTGPHRGLTADDGQAAAVIAYVKALK